MSIAWALAESFKIVFFYILFTSFLLDQQGPLAPPPSQLPDLVVVLVNAQHLDLPHHKAQFGLRVGRHAPGLKNRHPVQEDAE